MENKKNILIVRLSSLGDVLMSIPAVYSIKERDKKTDITWLVEGTVSRFLRYQPFVDSVIEFPRRQIVKGFKENPVEGLKGLIQFIRRLRETEYDIITDFHGIIKSALLSRSARGKRRIGFGAPYAKEMSHLFYGEVIEGNERRIHKVERNMLIARYLGVSGDAPIPPLLAPPEAQTYIESFLEREGIPSPFVAINPFSSRGNEYKRWDIENYGKLIKVLSDKLGLCSLILWGPGEEEEALYLKEISGEKAYLSCPTDIPQLFALLKKSKMYIGGDTGVMHLAAFAGVPVLALFGPTDVVVNAPYTPHSIIIRRDLRCSPCKNRGCNDRKCMEGITVEEVFKAVLEMGQYL
ncbi:MAG: glycosyltransferase family 9 protein [Syntrophorhabdaceae bacterium]|nr:glycosyltransferase family 9 protein [Syntrophorhabdaceae bacterium]